MHELVVEVVVEQLAGGDDARFVYHSPVARGSKQGVGSELPPDAAAVVYLA